MRESVLTYARWRYLIVALILGAAAAAAYILQDPEEPASGGTVIGYGLGTVGALLILWLMALGIRKRSYASTLGTVQGWLSAHIYLGVLLPIVVTLHSGFQLSVNIHGLAYLLMVLVIVSGFFGIFAYLKYPALLSENRQSVSRDELLGQLDDIDRRAKRTVAELPEEFGELIGSAINRTVLGGSRWAQISGHDLSRIVLPRTDEHDVVANPGQEVALDWIAEQQSLSTDPEKATTMAELSVLLRNRKRVLERLRKDIRMQGLMEAWLYLHVPLSFALLAALVTHIITVFLYW